MDVFHTTSSVLVLSICEKFLTCHYSLDDMILEKFLSVPSCCNTWSMRLILNSIPLSDRIYLGHMCPGRYSFMNVETIVSADLSGMGYDSGHPVR